MECGYNQVPVAHKNAFKTAVITPFGLFEFFFECQRFNNSISGDLSFVFVYIDDKLISSFSREEHKEYLGIVLKRLATNGIFINIDKCEWGVSVIDFLGCEISANGIRPAVDPTEVIEKFPAPTSVKELQRFLGTINFYHRFIDDSANLAFVLYEHLKKFPRNRQSILTKFTWTDECNTAFQNLKKALAKRTLLVHPKVNAEICLVTDASDKAVGAVLQQLNGNHWEPLAFFTRKISKTEQNYSVFDRELY